MNEQEKSSHRAKAELIIEKAKKKIKGGFLSNMFNSKSERLEDALELYTEAAKHFEACREC